MRSFFSQSPRKTLELLDIKENGNTITYVFDKPNNFVIHAGQYLSLYPTKMAPRAMMKPVLLAIVSGEHDNVIEVSFPKAAYVLSSKNMMQHYQSGSNIMIEGPFGNGFQYDASRPLLMIGAGSGLSLLSSIKRTLEKNPLNAQSSNSSNSTSLSPVEMIYSTKNLENIPNISDLSRWAAEPNNYFSLTADKKVPTHWHSGRISEHLKTKKISADTQVVLCGPDLFIKDTLIQLQTHGHSLNNIFISHNWIKQGENNIYPATAPEIATYLDLTSVKKKI